MIGRSYDDEATQKDKKVLPYKVHREKLARLARHVLVTHDGSSMCPFLSLAEDVNDGDTWVYSGGPWWMAHQTSVGCFWVSSRKRPSPRKASCVRLAWPAALLLVLPPQRPRTAKRHSVAGFPRSQVVRAPNGDAWIEARPAVSRGNPFSCAPCARGRARAAEGSKMGR